MKFLSMVPLLFFSSPLFAYEVTHECQGNGFTVQVVDYYDESMNNIVRSEGFVKNESLNETNLKFGRKIDRHPEVRFDAYTMTWSNPKFVVTGYRYDSEPSRDFGAVLEILAENKTYQITCWF